MIQTKYSKFDYLDISDSPNYWGLYVIGAGVADVPPYTDYPPTKHPDNYMFNWKAGRVLSSFAIVYIAKGQGIFETKEINKRVVKEGSIIFLFPNTWHRYRPQKKTGWKEYWVSFSGDQPRKLLENNILEFDKPILEIGLNETIINLFNHILDLLEKESLGFREIIASLTYQIIAQILAADKMKQMGGKKIEKIIIKAKIVLSENISSEVNYAKLAEDLNVGYSWFRKMFRYYTHLSPSQYHQLLRLNLAKNLLNDDTLRIGEIADKLGFQSVYYFSKFFKKKTGISPLFWRKSFHNIDNKIQL